MKEEEDGDERGRRRQTYKRATRIDIRSDVPK